MAKRTRERLIVEIEIVPALDGDDVAWATDRKLSPRQPLGRATVRCLSGVEQAYSALRKRRYVFDYDEQSAREAGIAKPQTATLSEGLSGDALVCLDRWAGGVLAHLRVNWERLATEPRSADTQHGPVTLPTLDTVRLQTSAWLPLDRRVLLATCTRGMTPCHVIVRVRAAE
jgi:hypothetical protein